MGFHWRAAKDKFKGEGVYFLTFVVKDRRPLLGELVPIPQPDVARQKDTDVCNKSSEMGTAEGPGGNPDLYTSHLARVKPTELGFRISEDIKNIGKRYLDVELCCKQIMPDHIHFVIYIKADIHKSVREMAHGFRLGITKIAKDIGVWKTAEVNVDSQGECHSQDSDGLILGKPYIRTLCHRGQLRRMIDYVHSNPDNAWMRKMHPEMYVIRRKVEIAGLLFDVMGKLRLLDYPDVNVVALKRELTKEEIEAEVEQAVKLAKMGVVTYSAAINEGEKAVTKAVRNVGGCEVVMMLDGFPKEGTEHARFYHPGGAYHHASGEGRLLLLASYPENYENPKLKELTEEELKRKAAEKGLTYHPIPHDSKRWRMIAGNMMLQMVAQEPW